MAAAEERRSVVTGKPARGSAGPAYQPDGTSRANGRSDPRAITTLVVDDEPLSRARLTTLLAREPDVVVVGQCANGVEAFNALTVTGQQLRPELVFLDVQMPDMDGLSVVEALGEELNETAFPEIVFVTAFSEYMERAFELHAIDYLRKPYTDARFRSALDHARRRVAARRAAQEQSEGERRYVNESAGVPVSADSLAELRRLLRTLNGGRQHDRVAIRDRTTGSVQLIEARQIVWIAAHGAGQVELHTDGGPLVWYRGIEAVDSELAALGFLRVHRTTLINPAHLVSAKPLTKGQYMLTMSDGAQFDTGRAFASNVEGHLASIPGGR